MTFFSNDRCADFQDRMARSHTYRQNLGTIYSPEDAQCVRILDVSFKILCLPAEGSGGFYIPCADSNCGNCDEGIIEFRDRQCVPLTSPVQSLGSHANSAFFQCTYEEKMPIPVPEESEYLVANYDRRNCGGDLASVVVATGMLL